MITTILFDLDATLLPLDQDGFVKLYLSSLAEKMAPHGYEPKAFMKALWLGCEAVIKNEGARLNSEVFWESFVKLCGEGILDDQYLFDEFYENEFQKIRDFCGYTPKAKEIVDKIKAAGLRVAVATNPVFPNVATESRLRWAGFDPSEFELYTTYENISLCKPNPAYYTEVARQLGVSPRECLMVGNDVDDDGAAMEAGMSFFLHTDLLINRKNKDISPFPQGSWDELEKYIEEMTGRVL